MDCIKEFIINFAIMKSYHVSIYTTGEELPSLDESNFFHSSELFHIIEASFENGLIWPLRGTIAVRLWDICYRLSVVVVRGSHPTSIHKVEFMEKECMLMKCRRTKCLHRCYMP